MDSAGKTALLTLLIITLATPAAADTTVEWNTNVRINQGVGLGTFEPDGTADLVGWVTVTSSKRVLGHFELRKCSGDQAIWDNFVAYAGSLTYVRIPNDGDASTVYIYPTISVTEDLITIDFNQQADYIGNILSDSWSLRFGIFLYDGITTPGCSGCNVRWSYAEELYGPYPECATSGPEVTNLMAVPNELMYDALSDVVVSCDVTDDTGVDTVTGEISIPGDGKSTCPMSMVSGDALSGKYSCPIYQSTLNQWVNVDGHPGVYWFKVIATDIDTNVNDKKKTWFNVTMPTTTSTTSTSTTTTVTIPEGGLPVKFEYYMVSKTPIEYCSIYTNLTGSWTPLYQDVQVENDSINSYDTSLPEGTYQWNVKCGTGAGTLWVDKRLNWVFTVCNGCKPCSEKCQELGYYSGDCITAADYSAGLCSDPYIVTDRGQCNEERLCCCKTPPPTSSTTTTTATTSTTTTISEFCGNGILEGGEDCDLSAPLPNNPCVVTSYPYCEHCACTDWVGGTTTTSSTSSTTSSSTTTITGSTTSTSSTSTSSTTSSTTTLTTLPSKSWNTGFVWNGEWLTGGYSPGGNANMMGDVKLTLDKHIIGNFELTRCTGDPSIWSSFTGSNMYLRLSMDPPNTFRITPSSLEVTPDKITFDFDSTVVDFGTVQDVWYVRFDIFIFDGITTPGCTGCNVRWTPSDWDTSPCTPA